MSTPPDAPPPILDSARVRAYAVIDDSVTWMGESGGPTVYVDGKLLSRVPRLAICLNYDERDYLLLYCNEQWEVLAAGGYPSFEQAKDRAKREYRGIESKWIDVA